MTLFSICTWSQTPAGTMLLALIISDTATIAPEATRPEGLQRMLAAQQELIKRHPVNPEKTEVQAFELQYAEGIL